MLKKGGEYEIDNPNHNPPLKPNLRRIRLYRYAPRKKVVFGYGYCLDITRSAEGLRIFVLPIVIVV